MPIVAAVACSPLHQFSKARQERIVLVAGLGVIGDAHLGITVQHRSRVARDPSRPNLRQVHLIHGELLEALAGQGFDIAPGDLGENILTRNLALLDLPTGTRLCIGSRAVVELTGLRNPCQQLDRFAPGLMDAVLDRNDDGALVRKAGVMAVVVAGGEVRPGDIITVQRPPPPHCPLEPV